MRVSETQTSAPLLPLRSAVWQLPTGSLTAAVMMSPWSLSASQVVLPPLTPAAALRRPFPSRLIPDRRRLWSPWHRLHPCLLAPAAWLRAWQRYACVSPRGSAHSSRGRRSCVGRRCRRPGPCAAAGRTAPSAPEVSSGGGRGSARKSPWWRRWRSTPCERTRCRLLRRRRCSQRP